MMNIFRYCSCLINVNDNSYLDIYNHNCNQRDQWMFLSFYRYNHSNLEPKKIFNLNNSILTNWPKLNLSEIKANKEFFIKAIREILSLNNVMMLVLQGEELKLRNKNNKNFTFSVSGVLNIFRIMINIIESNYIHLLEKNDKLALYKELEIIVEWISLLPLSEDGRRIITENQWIITQLKKWELLKICSISILAKKFLINLDPNHEKYDNYIFRIGNKGLERNTDIMFITGQASHHLYSFSIINPEIEKNINSKKDSSFFQSREVWPVAYLEKDFEKENVRILSASHRIFGNMNTYCLFSVIPKSLDEYCDDLIESMKKSDIGSKPIIFICYSLGGILLKIILSRNNEFTKKLAKNIKGVIFMGSPHYGTDVCDLLLNELKSYFPFIKRFLSIAEDAVTDEEAFNQMIYLYGFSECSYYVAKNCNKHLIKIDNLYSDLKLDTLSITEGKKCIFVPESKIPILVVNKETGFQKSGKHIHLSNKNHINLAKVVDFNDPTYVEVKSFLKEKFDKIKKINN